MPQMGTMPWTLAAFISVALIFISLIKFYKSSSKLSTNFSLLQKTPNNWKW